jgi:hypothetical protein
VKRSHRAKEITEIQKYKRENDRLKREVASLRKQLARIDLDRYSTVKDMIEEYRDSESVEEPTTDAMLEGMKAEWACKMAGCPGHLQIMIYARPDSTHYYRKCNECPNRTKSQIYVKSKVRGVVYEPEPKK